MPEIPTTADDVDDVPAECNDDPKLTAEEWAYVQAMAEGGDS